MKKINKSKKFLNQSLNSSNGGKISQMIMESPLMQKKKAQVDLINNSALIQRKKAEYDITFGNIIQREINTTSFQKSKNNLYLIDPTNDQKLISRGDSASPVPVPLYEMNKDKEQGSNDSLKIWTPNVRFLNNNEQDKVEKGKYLGDGFFNYDGLYGMFVSSPVNIYLLQSKLEEAETKIGSLPATEGIFGKNDCDKFAIVLQNSIAYAKAVVGEAIEQENVRNIGDVTTEDPENLKVEIGDKMKHIFPETASCEYHGSTVVAKDSNSLITLEAHVSKNLEHPQFHMRNGVKGFVEDNNQDGDMGNNVEIHPLGSANLQNREIYEYTYDMLKNEEAKKASLGVTTTNSEVLDDILEELSQDMANLYGWNESARKEYKESREAKERAKIRLNSQKKPTPSYII